jgi:hypothetical protein
MKKLAFVSLLVIIGFSEQVIASLSVVNSEQETQDRKYALWVVYNQSRRKNMRLSLEEFSKVTDVLEKGLISVQKKEEQEWNERPALRYVHPETGEVRYGQKFGAAPDGNCFLHSSFLHEGRPVAIKNLSALSKDKKVRTLVNKAYAEDEKAFLRHVKKFKNDDVGKRKFPEFDEDYIKDVEDFEQEHSTAYEGIGSTVDGLWYANKRSGIIVRQEENENYNKIDQSGLKDKRLFLNRMRVSHYFKHPEPGTRLVMLISYQNYPHFDIFLDTYDNSENRRDALEAEKKYQEYLKSKKEKEKASKATVDGLVKGVKELEKQKAALERFKAKQLEEQQKVAQSTNGAKNIS